MLYFPGVAIGWILEDLKDVNIAPSPGRQQNMDPFTTYVYISPISERRPKDETAAD